MASIATSKIFGVMILLLSEISRSSSAHVHRKRKTSYVARLRSLEIEYHQILRSLAHIDRSLSSSSSPASPKLVADVETSSSNKLSLEAAAAQASSENPEKLLTFTTSPGNTEAAGTTTSTTSISTTTSSTSPTSNLPPACTNLVFLKASCDFALSKIMSTKCKDPTKARVKCSCEVDERRCTTLLSPVHFQAGKPKLCPCV